MDYKEKSLIRLVESKKAESYKTYSDYLLEFNAKQFHTHKSS